MGKRRNMASIDRLSALPDPILSHILSLLPTTKDAVKTTILAKRWSSLWSHAPTLHFDHQNQHVINRVLMLHQVRSIDSFRLILSLDRNDCSEYQLETWIIAAIDRNVNQLHLCFLYKRILPRRLLTCETLVDLSLDGCGPIPVNTPVCLPRLKKLLLISVLYEADESLPNLLSGCPVLEELEIKSAHGLVCCNVSSPTVTRLTVSFHDYSLVINTPALGYLDIDDIMPENVLCGAWTSLIEADFFFDNVKWKQDVSLYSSASLLGLVDRLTNVKFLTLCFTNPTKISDSLLSTWTMSFPNLTTLKLKADCRFLFKILENAHSLEILIFKEVCEAMKEWMEPKKVPTCLLSHVRTIRLVHTMCTKHDFEIVRYLLRNARVLQRMEIKYPEYHDYKKKHLLQEISRFEQGSGSCELAILDDYYP